jgi:hypothetical protein
MTPRYSLLLKSLDSAKFFFGKKNREENTRIERQLLLLSPCDPEELLAVSDNYQEQKQLLIVYVSLFIAYVLVIIACVVIAQALPVESILKFILVVVSVFLSRQTTKTLSLILVARKMMSIMHHFLLIHNFRRVARKLTS